MFTSANLDWSLCTRVFDMAAQISCISALIYRRKKLLRLLISSSLSLKYTERRSVLAVFNACTPEIKMVTYPQQQQEVFVLC